ncbi:MAG: diaminopimelate epimerase [Deltaproteobacteria bacterium]|jgi:diaminopimelate epimerase|nr:diaminopimelate epimerase [Deltaproteobacteria bacterium]
MRFTKMHGIGNDYVYINGFVETVDEPEKLALKISDRHFGVGSDGLILVLPSQVADLKMQMFNADGSEAEMCGNGSRCVGKFAFDKELIKKTEFTLETKAGIKYLKILAGDLKKRKVQVDIGEPILDPAQIPVRINQRPVLNYPILIDDTTWNITCVSMGNPHAVVITQNIEKLDLPTLGPKFENHQLFPNRINTEFIEVITRSLIKMRVWERGSAETLACGTGACASVVATILNGLCDRQVVVKLIGGDLEVYWSAEDNHIYMTGDAVTVFEGEYL